MSALIDESRIATPLAPFRPRIRPRPTEEIVTHLVTPRTIWCAGCGNGIATRAIVDAILNLKDDPQVRLDLDKVVIVAGIGCSGRIVQYVNFCTVHTTHGRALTVATGAKLADPSLQVIVVMGDGDCMAIGGNHLIHAARRNLDLTAIVFNNSIYGMTGGQASPTTFEGDRSATTVYGTVEAAFDTCELARAAGATYVARGTSYAYQQLVRVIAGGIAHPGFAFIEAMVSCPTYYGRQNRSGDAAQMLLRQHERGIPVEKFDHEGPREKERYPVGVLHHVSREEYSAAYERVIADARRS
jgi:2-oxoglutarate/2-oxoacid ferredoxin oxidoreductase subunit beta